MFLFKNSIIMFIIVMIIIAFLSIIVPDKYMNSKWLIDYVKNISNDVSKNQNKVNNTLRNIK